LRVVDYFSRPIIAEGDTIMKLIRSVIFSGAVAAILLGATFMVSAQQLVMPRPSQWASTTQTVGVTDITIVYSRPAVQGRKIFATAPATMASRAKGQETLDDQNKRQAGEPIVAYNHYWRTGANEATRFEITSDVTINGQKLAAGKYSLHTLPGEDEWTIIFNSDAGQWGSFNYNPSKDVLRVKAKPEMMKDNQELLSFSFDPVTETSAQVNIRWERVRVPFTVGVDSVGLAMAKARSAIASAKPDDWRIRSNVGQYAYDNGLKDEGMTLLTEALKLVDQSIAAKEGYGNLQGRANILLEMGRLDEGYAAADKALVFGKANKVDTSGLEKRLSDVRAMKK
jgi:hypothetical protein